MAVCESGDIEILGPDRLSWNVSQILRTGQCWFDGNSCYVLTGSDNNMVSLFRDGQQEWSVTTKDRVREVLVVGKLCLAVSEDRFLYVLSLTGEFSGGISFLTAPFVWMFWIAEETVPSGWVWMAAFTSCLTMGL